MRVFLGILGVLLTTESFAGVLSCIPGEWTLKSQDLRPDGSHVESRATDTRYCQIFDDALQVSEFRSLDAKGDVTFRGVSLSLVRDNTQQVFWAMVDDPGYTLPYGHIDGNTIRHRGTGTDRAGDFQERAITTVADNGDYRFQMDRKYQGSAQWLEDFNVVIASREADMAPDLADITLNRRHAAGRGSGVWHHMGRVKISDQFVPRHIVEQRQVILDGHAVIAKRIYMAAADQVLRTTYTFETLYQGNWRELEWSPAKKSVRETTFKASGDGWEGHIDGQMAVYQLRAETIHRQVTENNDLIAEWWLHPRDDSRPYQKPIPDSGCGDYAFLLGDFRMDAAAMQPDRSHMAGVGFVSGYKMLGDTMIAADMHVMFMDGSSFRGVTIRSQDTANPARWHISWVSQGAPTTPSGLTHVSEDRCVERFSATDQHGEAIGDLVLSNHTRKGFDVHMDRQYTNGPTIPDLWVYAARRLP